MTKEQAYCCLNCTASANCCGACGECSACCEDCGDMSACKSSAFLDKNNRFYLKWEGTHSGYSMQSDWHFDDDRCIDHSVNYIQMTPISSFDSDGKCEIEFSSNTNYSKTCCECECNRNEGGRNILMFGNEKYNITSYSFGAPTQDPDGEGCENLRSYSERLQGDGFGCPNPSEQEEEQYSHNTACVYEEEYNSDQDCTTTTIKSYIKATVSWTKQLHLYDSNGDLVGSPWSILPAPDPYDPLDPIRVVNAPGCHFFHL